MTMVSARFRLAILLGAGMAPFMRLRKARAAEFEFRLGHPLTTADAAHTAMTALADGLKKRSDGRIDVTVFPADQLGAQADIGEMVRQGRRGHPAHRRAVPWEVRAGRRGPPGALPDGRIRPNSKSSSAAPGSTISITGSPPKDFGVISWSNYFGTRQILSKKPVHEPKDLADLNFRCGAAPMYVEMVKAMGARPVTTAFAEVYTGLAQGTLDLLEAPLPTMWASKFYEQAKHVSLTAHMIGWDPVVMSETVYQAMPADLQKIVLEEAATHRRHDQAQDERKSVTSFQNTRRPASRSSTM